jgi:hypothetical protein
MKRSLFVLLAFVVVSSTLGQSPEAAKVRITTWNLEWFPNGSPREAPPEKRAQRIAAAADVLRLPLNMRRQSAVLERRICFGEVSRSPSKFHSLSSILLSVSIRSRVSSARVASKIEGAAVPPRT